MKTKYYFEYNREGKRPLRVPMTEEQFLAVKDLPDRWFINISGCVLEVSKAEYDDYHKEREHSNYCRRDKDRKVVHPVKLEELDTERLIAYSIFTLMEAQSLEESVEESLMQKVEIKRLYEALDELGADERSLIHAIYYCNQNQKTLAKKLGITQQGVSRRLSAVLKKLRSMLSDLAV